MTAPSLPPIRIPLSDPCFDDREEAALVETIRSGWVSTASPRVKQFESALAAHLGGVEMVATNCGTAALHLAMVALGLGPGDEVIVPALTFVASVNPVRYVGATPVFADIDPLTLGLSVATVEALITPRTKAILAVHLMGLPCDILPLAQLCHRHGIALIEDAAEALGATVNGQPVGTFGRFGALSFNGNKTMTTGSGGALICPDSRHGQWIRALSAQHRLLDSQEIEHVGLGFNYRMNALQAALGLTQLDKLPYFVQRRQEIARRYQAAFADSPHGRLLDVAPTRTAEGSYWLSCLQLNHPDQRMPLIASLRRQGIEARPLFKPLPLQLAFQDCGAGEFPGAMSSWQRVVCLPSSPQLTVADQEEVIAQVQQFLASPLAQTLEETRF